MKHSVAVARLLSPSPSTVLALFLFFLLLTLRQADLLVSHVSLVEKEKEFSRRFVKKQAFEWPRSSLLLGEFRKEREKIGSDQRLLSKSLSLSRLAGEQEAWFHFGLLGLSALERFLPCRSL